MYVPLRVHGHHSLLTGVDSPAALVERARGLGLDTLALADVDSMAGMVDFLAAARAEEVRPIVAAELSDTGGRPGRLVALVQDEEGYRSLCRLVSARHLGRPQGEPDRAEEVDGDEGSFDLVQAAILHQRGLVFLADHPRLLLGLFGRVPERALLAAVSPGAVQLGAARRDPRTVRGRARNTHLVPYARPRPSDDPAPSQEALDAPKTPAPGRAVPALALIDAARATGVATVAVPDVYWALPSGAEDHRVRVAIKHNALLAGLPREWLAEPPGHLPSFAEMCALYADVPDVPGPWRGAAEAGVPPMVARTRDVARLCRYTPPLDRVLFPEVALEDDETPYSRLCELAFAGARERYRPLRPEVLRRLDYELTTIQELGFAPYFLLVKRIADFARESGIPCVGRGSAADSLVAYSLALTDADPFRYRLPFERFLNPARSDRPDVDLDFCWRRRDEVLEHVYELFGHERTAMICTLNRFGPRAAFREAALVHGIPPAEVNRWSPQLPMYLTLEEAASRGHATEEDPGEPAGRAAANERGTLPAGLASNPIARAFAAVPEATGFPFDDERFARALRSAHALLHAPRHFGLHPGGVVVAPGRITDLVPCQRSAKGPVVTQLDKRGVEAIGLVKMDLLGNRALTTIDDCLGLLAARGVRPDLEGIAEDDPLTARSLREGRTLGCFQVESPGMRHLLQQTGARTMDDVIQAVALIRPGPAASGMKDAYVRRFRGWEEPTPPHPRLVDVLWDTHGVMLYQEDVMHAAARVAGMDLAEADQLRRDLQERHADGREALRTRFLAGCARECVGAEEATHVWELIAGFASFAFCKAHAVTYGRIAYRAVWLKTRYPAEFLAAFLASDTGYYPRRVYVEEARRLGVPILRPDVNKSARPITVEAVEDGVALRVGLEQVKGLSERTLTRILEGRAQGPYLSLPDFLERTGARTDEAQTLVQCGAFDGFDRTRPELSWRLHLLRAPARRVAHGADLDPAQLAACRATERSRARDTLAAARARTGGWSRQGLGVGGARLRPGEPSSLFPEPETPGLVLPGLPDTDPITRGRLELELLGLTIQAHPVALFPCPADERIARYFGPGGVRAGDALHSSVGEAGPRRTGSPKPERPVPCARLPRFAGGRVTLRGWPAATRRVRTSDARLMRFLTLEDESGLAEVVLFPDVYERDGRRLAELGVLCVTGVVEEHMGACALHAERVW